jgi:uncharacterized protein
VSSEYRKPLPVADKLTEPFWQAARERRLLVQRCGACEEAQFYPRRHCVHCFAPDPAWVESNGRGRVHSFTVTHRNQDPGFAVDCPYVFALVELDEGVVLSANLIGVPPEDVEIGMPVRVVYVDVTTDVSLPQFVSGGV